MTRGVAEIGACGQCGHEGTFRVVPAWGARGPRHAPRFVCPRCHTWFVELSPTAGEIAARAAAIRQARAVAGRLHRQRGTP